MTVTMNRYSVPKLYWENQSIKQVHNSTYMTAIDEKYNEVTTLIMGAEVMTYMPQVSVNGRHIQ